MFTTIWRYACKQFMKQHDSLKRNTTALLIQRELLHIYFCILQYIFWTSCTALICLLNLINSQLLCNVHLPKAVHNIILQKREHSNILDAFQEIHIITLTRSKLLITQNSFTVIVLNLQSCYYFSFYRPNLFNR